ncbi:hypothetical protein [Ligilactobacillus agilis]
MGRGFNKFFNAGERPESDTLFVLPKRWMVS